jgi:quercetin dioxygenase-like cupin family protein
MTAPRPIDAATHVFDISRDFSISLRQQKPGPPQRVDGMTVGIVSMNKDAPHNGEVHPDGDELLYVIAGRVEITLESAADQPTILGPGEACVVPKGAWHRVHLLEPTQLLHITPGPRGDHRPL